MNKTKLTQRHSLQPSLHNTPPRSPLRHTKSYIYGKAKEDLTPQVSTIIEIPSTVEEETTLEEEPSEIVGSHLSIISTGSTRSKHSYKKRSDAHSHTDKLGHDNPAFEREKKVSSFEHGEQHFSRNSSAANSLRSTSRDPSVQSLSVIREQYCCFTKWTPCERILGATVGVLIVIILVLAIFIGVYIHGTKSDSAADKFFSINF